MTQPTLMDIARVKTVPATVAKPTVRITRTFATDPNGLKIINDLVDLVGSRPAAAKLLGIKANSLTNWAAGEPIRKTYSDLALFIIKDLTKTAAKTNQHSAVVTLDNAHKKLLQDAVENLGGQYTLLTYPE